MTENLREKYRSEWENLVIDLLSRGYKSSEARIMADEILEDKYYDESNGENWYSPD